MIRILILCSLYTFLLTACSLNNSFQPTASPFQGKSVNALMEKLGPPDQVITNPDGSSAYVYVQNVHRFAPPKAPVVATTLSGGKPITVTSQPTYEPAYQVMKCTMIYQINNNIITSAEMQGNGCQQSKQSQQRIAID